MLKSKKPLSVIVTLLMLLSISITAAFAAAPVQQEEMDIVDTAVSDGRFTTLVTALQAAGLVDTLKSEGPFTVFAPTDDAFAALPDGTLDALLADTQALADVLLYHVVPGKVMAADVVNLTSADTALGQPASISVDGGSVMIDNAQVIITDIETSNGVIHVIDAVIIPASDEAMMAEKSMEMSEAQQDIVDTAVSDGRFTTLVTALEAAGLVDTLKSEGPFTVFAPTDDAFAALPEGTLDALLADPQALSDVLLYHVVPGKVMAADVVNLTSADTALGQPASISFDGTTVMIDDAQVIIPDIETSNGVIHVIDAVIVPSASDEAMMMDGAALGCSQDYIVQSEDWLSKIADKFYGDPVAYTVIFEATNAAASAGGAYDAIANPDIIEVGQTLCIPEVAGQTIVEIAVNDGRFTTLVTALQAANLVETLSSEGPFTVFAPTDDAFAALPAGTLDALLADTEALAEVLLYHVVPGEVMAAEVVTLDSADTALGQPVVVSVDGGTVKINESQVILTDIQGSNGVIHVIDAVLLPAQ